MNSTFKNNLVSLAAILLMLLFQACNSGNKKPLNINDSIPAITGQIDSSSIKNMADPSETATVNTPVTNDEKQIKKDQSVVFVYNFHVTNRCPSCIAIEEATTKTLITYFSDELKTGRIKRQILNVDDEANSAISEKYQAFGSAMFVTQVLKGKENTTDLTGDGFKYARNKEERFIEILKSRISEYLK